MLTLVVCANLILSLLCLYAAWRIWRFSRSLARAADVLIRAEWNTHRVLDGAPEAIFQGQVGVAQLRQRYQQWVPQFRQVQQALAVVSLGLSLWRGGLPLGRRRSDTPTRVGRSRRGHHTR